MLSCILLGFHEGSYLHLKRLGFSSRTKKGVVWLLFDYLNPARESETGRARKRIISATRPTSRGKEGGTLSFYYALRMRTYTQTFLELFPKIFKGKSPGNEAGAHSTHSRTSKAHATQYLPIYASSVFLPRWFGCFRMDAAVLREFDWFRMDVADLREFGCLRMNVAVLRQFGCLIDVDLQILGEVAKKLIVCLDKSNLVTSPFPRVSQGTHLSKFKGKPMGSGFGQRTCTL